MMCVRMCVIIMEQFFSNMHVRQVKKYGCVSERSGQEKKQKICSLAEGSVL